MGVAVSDPTGIIATGLRTIHYRSLADALTEIERLIVENEIQQIVVGFPCSLKGTTNEAMRATEEFIQRLRETFHLPVHREDERFTSVIANQTIKQLGRSPSRNREKKDELSARLILQSFLDRQKRLKNSHETT